MKPDAAELNDGFALLACGSSGHWSVDLDESTDGAEWSLQLDGPQVYLAFSVDNLGVIVKALDYLRSGRTHADALPLGHFGSAGVSLHWDNEEFPRCFLIVYQPRTALRVTLFAEDIRMLAEALEQVVEELPPRGSRG